MRLRAIVITGIYLPEGGFMCILTRDANSINSSFPDDGIYGKLHNNSSRFA